VSIDPDEIHEIDDFSSATLQAQVDRLLASSSAEHLIYRESELDEIWRLLDLEIASGRADGAPVADLAPLESMRASVMQAHDLVGNDGNLHGAAQRLRNLIR
jgi:hypothetical protein